MTVDHTFIERAVIGKRGETAFPVSIRVCVPEIRDDGLYSSNVLFIGADTYNADIKGLDQFNAIECALDYINKICVESEDPYFFWPNGELFGK